MLPKCKETKICLLLNTYFDPYTGKKYLIPNLYTKNMT